MSDKERLNDWKQKLFEISTQNLLRRDAERRAVEVKRIVNNWEFTPDAHVMPRGDLREHDENTACWCGPTVDDGVTVHHSIDERETYEQGRKAQ